MKFEKMISMDIHVSRCIRNIYELDDIVNINRTVRRYLHRLTLLRKPVIDTIEDLNNISP